MIEMVNVRFDEKALETEPFQSFLPHRHTDAVSDQVRRMSDYDLAFPQPAEDFDFKIGAMACFNLSPLHQPVLDNERIPSLPRPEHRAQGSLQRLVRLPDDDPRLHAIAVA
jgi:hypothetical protein